MKQRVVRRGGWRERDGLTTVASGVGEWSPPDRDGGCVCVGRVDLDEGGCVGRVDLDVGIDFAKRTK